MKAPLVAIGLAVLAVLALSAYALVRERNAWALCQVAGAGFLMVVVLAHVAEEFHLFPGMGWGQPASVGHYVDLAGAILGLVLLPLGIRGRRRRRGVS